MINLKKEKEPSVVRRLMEYSGSYKGLMILGLVLSGIAMIY